MSLLLDHLTKEERHSLDYVRLTNLSLATPFLRNEIRTILMSGLDMLRSVEYLCHADVAIVARIAQDIVEDLKP